MLFFIATATASVTGHYHPEDIQVQSKVFVEAAERLSTVYDERSRSLRQFASALNEYREALDLLGSRASDVEQTRHGELLRAYAKEEAAIQFVADGVVEDFDSAMVAAMDRAISQLGEVQRCKARLQTGPRLPGMPVREEPNPECEGRELNDDIAKAMDADAELKATVDAVLSRPWPSVTLEQAPQAPIGDDVTEWVLVHDLLVGGAQGALELIDDRDDAWRESIDEALESEGELDVDALRSQVRRIEQQTADARAALATPILAMAEERLAKKAKDANVGWCANPRAFGGCTGRDATRERLAMLLDDKRFTKSLP